MSLLLSLPRKAAENERFMIHSVLSEREREKRGRERERERKERERAFSVTLTKGEKPCIHKYPMNDVFYVRLRCE